MHTLLLLLWPSVLTANHYKESNRCKAVRLFHDPLVSLLGPSESGSCWDKTVPASSAKRVFLPFALTAMQAHVQLAHSINFLSLLNDELLVCLHQTDLRRDFFLASLRRALPTRLSTGALVAFDVAPRWSERGSVLSAAGRWGCCGEEHTWGTDTEQARSGLFPTGSGCGSSAGLIGNNRHEACRQEGRCKNT